MACGNQTSLFGDADKYIKFYNSNLVAIEGANTVETQFLNFLRIPYSQLLRGRILLQAGQVNYLLNHLGLGDNATLVSIVAKYDPKSKIEEDNYVVYSYYDDLSTSRAFCEIMILTGNSTNRVPQLYLTNPNTDYDVLLDVMIAKKDDTYSFYEGVINQSGSSFFGLTLSSVRTYVVDESIKIVDSSGNALLYVELTNITSIEKSGLILSLNDTSMGEILLKFTTQYYTNQGFSLLNYILENSGIDTDTLSPLEDDTAPVLTFYNQVGGVTGSTTSYISFNGATAGPYDTSYGYTFSTDIVLSTYGTISNYLLIDLLVDSVLDNRDGAISITGSDITITRYTTDITSITESGTYSIDFSSIKDLAENAISAEFTLNIT